MGEFGDALSTAITSQTDLRPSLFEVLAQDNLTSAIRPAIAHAFRVSVHILLFLLCYAYQ